MKVSGKVSGNQVPDDRVLKGLKQVALFPLYFRELPKFTKKAVQSVLR